jgi:hypothetical protein
MGSPDETDFFTPEQKTFVRGILHKDKARAEFRLKTGDDNYPDDLRYRMEEAQMIVNWAMANRRSGRQASGVRVTRRRGSQTQGVRAGSPPSFREKDIDDQQVTQAIQAAAESMSRPQARIIERKVEDMASFVSGVGPVLGKEVMFSIAIAATPSMATPPVEVEADIDIEIEPPLDEKDPFFDHPANDKWRVYGKYDQVLNWEIVERYRENDINAVCPWLD